MSRNLPKSRLAKNRVCIVQIFFGMAIVELSTHADSLKSDENKRLQIFGEINAGCCSGLKSVEWDGAKSVNAEP